MRRAAQLMFLLLLPLLAVAVASSSSAKESDGTVASQPRPTTDATPTTTDVSWPVDEPFLPVEAAWLGGAPLLPADAKVGVLSWYYTTTDQYFYPESRNDTVWFQYNLAQAANITSTVVDSQGQMVRVLEQWVSRPSGSQYWVGWDGRDDQGATVPDGVYTVHVVGENQDGPTNEITVRVVVDGRAPGTLTAPEPGDVVSGSSMEWVFTPTEGFDVEDVSVWCDGGGSYSSWADAPGEDGTFSSALEVTWCTNGDNQLSGYVEWKDPFGRWQYGDVSPVLVTVVNAPALAWNYTPDQYFYPDSEGQDKSFSAQYRLSQSANVTSTVVDSQGHTVRVLEQGLLLAAGTRSVDWDGCDDQGAMVPDGEYTVHVVGENQVGSGEEITARAGVDTRTPGVLTAPEAGDIVSGSTVWVFAPTEGFHMTYVYVGCDGGGRYVYTAGEDGTFSSTISASCTNGANQVSGDVAWQDPFGASHYWYFPPVPVTVVNPAVLSWYSTSERYFSPDGDGQNESFEFRYSISQRANVTSTVVDSQGQTVRVLEQGLSRNAMPTYGAYSVSWDGRDDLGRVVPDGVYTVRVVAENQAGPSNEITVRAGVDTRIPGALTAPEPGDVVSGTSVRWAFTPTDGFTVSSVSAGCSSTKATTSTRGADGTFSSTVDVTGCSNDGSQFSGSVTWRDAFGASQSWSFQPVPVSVLNVPVLSWYSATEQYFYPAGSGQGESFSALYRLSQSANITSTVVDPQGLTVRVLEQGILYAATNDNTSPYYYKVFWDGRGDQGQVVPDGVYTVHMVAENQAGLSNEITLRVGIDNRVPGSLTAPEPGAAVSGASVGWVFTPTDGFNLTQAGAYCSGGGGSYAYAPGADGTFSSTMDASGCTNGDNQFSGSVSWRDPLGVSHWWYYPPVPVTVVNPSVLSWNWAPDRYFSPGGDWQDDSFSFYYQMSQPASITSTVVDSQGLTVRTLEQGVARDARGYYGVTWDGKDDQGQVVPDGVYTVHVVGENVAGPTNEITVHAGVDTRAPGALTIPESGAVVSGSSVRWVFTPAEGFNVTDVSAACSGGASSGVSAPGADGMFSSMMDVTGCYDGDNWVYGSVSWLDRFGASHYWSFPSVPVTVVNVPLLSWVDSAQDKYFSPDGDGQDEWFSAQYRLPQPASVTSTVVDAQGQTVRVLEQGVWRPWVFGTYEVSWDGRDDQGQVVPDGVYTVHVVAANEAGTSNEITVRAGVDTRVLGAMTAPAPGDTLTGLVSFVFAPTSGLDVQRVQFSVSTGGSVVSLAPMADGTWRTSVSAQELLNGPAAVTATVYWTDPFGVQQQWTTPPHAVVVNKTSPPPLTVSATPQSGPAPLAVELAIDTSDPQGRPVTYWVNYGDGTSVVTGTSVAPYPTVKLSHTYAQPGAYQPVVIATNNDGGSTTRQVSVVAEGQPNSPPVVDVTASSSSGAVPLPVAFTIDATDADGDVLTYTVDFGDKSPVAKGTVTAAPVMHTYTTPGTYMARVEVSDGQAGIVRFTRVTAVLNEPLVAVAGEPLRAVAGQTVWFDASASRPSAAITKVAWDFGDGTTGSGWQPSHVYAEAGDYTATVTVYVGTNTATATTTVNVSAPTPFAGVEVTVRSGSDLLQGATATYITPDGARVQAVSGPDGVARLVGVADGTQAIYVTAPGYLPVAGEVVVVDGHGSMDATLVSGDITATTLDYRQLTEDEIVELGIDTTDPANQNVFEAKVRLAVANMPGGNMTVAYNGSGDVVHVSGSIPGYQATPTIIAVGGARAVQWMIVPVKGSWLKEFFEVRLVVQNLTSSPFSFDDGEARLDIPEGLSLAPTAAQQSLTVAVPDIPGGGSETVSWVLRGDIEGDYDLTADYSAVLGPVGEAVHAEAKADRPLKVWGGSAVRWAVKADPQAIPLNPFRITLTMTNVTPEDTGVAVYNPAFEVSEGTGYLMAPETDYSKTVPVLYPGQTVEMDFIFYSRLYGGVNVNDPTWKQSFILPTGGNVDPATGGITLRATSTEHLDVASAWIDMPDQVAPGKMGLAIQWEEVDGATGYDLWGRNSLDEGDWELVTDGVRDGLPSSTRVLDDDSTQLYKYYTVISHLPDGTTKPSHVIEQQGGKPIVSKVAREDLVDVSDSSSLSLGNQCYDVLMLNVAGSGQPGTRGEQLDSLSTRLETKLTGIGGPYRSFRSVYLDYPALPVSALWGDGDYFASIDTGVANLKAFLNSRSAQCPDEKLVLAGYSQGALVISIVLDEWWTTDGLAYERLGGIYLIANPANSPYFGGNNIGTSHGATGIAAARYWYPSLTSDLASITYSLCNFGDPVCATSGIVGDVGDALIIAGDYLGKKVGIAVLDGIETHTSYQDRSIDELDLMAAHAAYRLLGMPVLKSGNSVTTLANSEFTTTLELKYLRNDVESTWDFKGACVSYLGETSPLPMLHMTKAAEVSAEVKGTAPPGYFVCPFVVTGAKDDHHPEGAHQTVRELYIKSGWAAIVSSARPSHTVDPNYVLQPVTMQVLDADGNPVQGAEVYFRLTGSATFPDGSQVQMVKTDEQGLAVSTTPIPVPGQSGPATLSAEVPGLEPVFLASQDEVTGPGEGEAFTTVPVPTLSGSPQVGQTLTVEPGVWEPEPDRLQFQWLRDGEPIEGATGATYTLVVADADSQVSVRVTGSAAGYVDGVVESDPVLVTAGDPQEFTAAPVPTLNGSAQVGQTLTVEPGAWEPEPDRLEFQWLRAGEPIEGATAPSYTVTVADLGQSIAVTVTGTKAGYVTQAKTSQVTGPVTPALLTATPTPTISGTAQVGQVLTADAGTWEPVPVTLAYQWLRDGTPIEGATDATYALVAADADRRVSVRVTGSASGYADSTVTSESVLVAPGDPVEPGDEVFTTVPLPTISGTAQVGQTLTAEPGPWEPEPDRLEFQWLRDGTPIESATAPSYTVTVADLGQSIAVTVTGTKAGYATQAKTSQATQAVAPAALTATPTPAVSGTAQVGQVLTADAGRWEPVSVTLTYQWLRDGTPIVGATDATYALVAADADKQVSVRVIGSAPGYADGVVESEPVLVAAQTGNGNGSNNGNGPDSNSGSAPGSNSGNGNGPGSNSGNGNGSANGNGPGTNNGKGNGQVLAAPDLTTGGLGFANAAGARGPDEGVGTSSEGSPDSLSRDAGTIADSPVAAMRARLATVLAAWLMLAAGVAVPRVRRRVLGSQTTRLVRSPDPR